VLPSGRELYRQAVPFQESRNKPQCMCRMAAMNSPPGGFWKFSRNTTFQPEMKETPTIQHMSCKSNPSIKF